MPGRLSTLAKLLAVALALGLTVRALDSTQARRRLAARNPPRQPAPATPVSGPVVVRIVLGDEDRRFGPEATLRHGLDDTAERQVVVGHHGAGRGKPGRVPAVWSLGRSMKFGKSPRASNSFSSRMNSPAR